MAPPLPRLDPEDQRLWRSQVRRFSNTLDSGRIEHQGRIPGEVIEHAAELGLFAISIPTAYGGLELGLSGACEVAAQLAEADRSVATSVGLHAGLGTRGLVRFGSEALKHRYLPSMAAGEIIGAFAATEPGAGSDLMAVSTRAEVVGDQLRISGEKCFVTNGGFAKLFTVLVKTPGLGGRKGGRNSHSLVCIPADAPGVQIGAEENKLGIRASSTVTVHFDNVTVPKDHLLQAPGDGMAQAHEILEWGRTLMSAGCVGTARTALERTLEHIQNRIQFGKPLDKFEAVQAQVVEMAGELAAMEALVQSTALAADRGESISATSMAAKVFCSEGAFAICDRALQLHGALGFIEDTGIARLSRDCRVTRIFEGANDVLLLHHGTTLLSKTYTPTQPHELDSAPSSVATQQLAQAQQDLKTKLGQLRKRFGVRIIREQLQLQAVARAHIAIQASQQVLAASFTHAASTGSNRAVAEQASIRLAGLAQSILLHSAFLASLQPSTHTAFKALFLNTPPLPPGTPAIGRMPRAIAPAH